MYDFRGRVAIVTGAGSHGDGIGIGEAIARVLGRLHASVVLGDIDPKRLENTADSLLAEGSTTTPVQFDVTEPADCERLIDECVAKYGRLDVVINCVGVIGPSGSAEVVDLDAWDRTMAVNVRSVVLTTRFALPHLKSSGGGAIVNVASVSGLRGGHPNLAYPTSKGAMVAMTRAMAVHHGRQGVRVNCVAPGMVHTPLVVARGLSEEMRGLRAASNLLATEGTAWDVAHAVAFLASDAARWITGAVLPVDAGVTAGDYAKPTPE